jgi:predicted small integral membrane protein
MALLSFNSAWEHSEKRGEARIGLLLGFETTSIFFSENIAAKSLLADD